MFLFYFLIEAYCPPKHIHASTSISCHSSYFPSFHQNDPLVSASRIKWSSQPNVLILLHYFHKNTLRLKSLTVLFITAKASLSWYQLPSWVVVSIFFFFGVIKYRDNLGENEFVHSSRLQSSTAGKIMAAGAWDTWSLHIQSWEQLIHACWVFP